MTEIDDLVAEWNLRPDGSIVRTPGGATILPVRSLEVQAVLKVVAGEDQAHLALRRWNGDGAVGLLRADPRRRAMLLQRLHTANLETVDDDYACEVVAALYRRLHQPAMPQLRSLPDLLGRWSEEFAALPRSAPIPHRLVQQAASLCRDLAAMPAEHLLHGDLHYRNVLAGDRQPWLAISPKPLNGDPAFELAPMLWNRWDELADHPRYRVRRRLLLLTEAAGLDEDHARSWIIVRVVRQALETLSSLVEAPDAGALTRYITLAKAVSD